MPKKAIEKEINETFTAIVRLHNKITIPHGISKKHEIKEDDIVTLTMTKLFREA
ncbi:MAG: hypothetical protein IMZ64_06245 [Bacteroidetes bacterium]|nr:hypothetical protein [Bacteroidota bacterium]